MSADTSGKISLALGGSKRLGKPAPTNGVKRPHASLQDHEEEEEHHGKTQTVSHFDKSAGGAIDEQQPKIERGPLVIAPQANRDWKEASQRNKRQRSGKALEADRAVQNGHAQVLGAEEETKPVFGLNIQKRAQDEDETNGHATVEEVEQNQQPPLEPNGETSIKQKTLDEEAMDALMGNAKKSGLVLPAMTEAEAFERDHKDAPDMATLDDYARVPVEEFGAALLRGMGWKDGDGIGSNRGKKMEKTKLPERRPALLGIGAKEEAAVAQELGTWGKAAKGKRAPPVVYNPVLLRDKQTGELFTEEELEKRKAKEEREKYEMEFEEKERRRRDRDDGERDRGSDRKGKDRERDRDRDRRKHDDSDDEYYRRKEKDKRRRERERDDRDYDRERSRRHDSDRERHREKDRKRDRRR